MMKIITPSNIADLITIAIPSFSPIYKCIFCINAINTLPFILLYL